MGSQKYARNRRPNREIQLDVAKKLRRMEQQHRYYENRKERQRREEEQKLYVSSLSPVRAVCFLIVAIVHLNLKRQQTNTVLILRKQG